MANAYADVDEEEEEYGIAQTIDNALKSITLNGSSSSPVEDEKRSTMVD